MIDALFFQEIVKGPFELVSVVCVYVIWDAGVAHNLLESLCHRLLILELEGLREDDSREDVLNDQEVLEGLSFVLGVRGRAL